MADIDKNSPLFSTIAEEAMMGIMAFSGEPQRCIYINKLAREIISHTSSMPLSEILVDMLFPKKITGNSRVFSEELLKHEGLTQDLVLSKLNGSNFMANIGIKHLTVNGQNQILLMFQDTTFQKKLQKEIGLKQTEINKAYKDLLKQNQQLKELDLAKDRFIALTTHELRTPVSAIVATTDVLVNHLYDDGKQRDGFIVTLHEQSNQLLTLVNDILDFAKIQAGKMEYYVELSTLNDVLTEQTNHYKNMGAKENISLDFENPSKKEWRCYFDQLRLSQVIGNILNNAIKFNKANGKVLITLEEDEAQNFSIICITDTGRGIDAASMEKVFNEFETVTEVSRHHKGTGLGMPISKRIIESMGGLISVVSELNVGSTFKIHIPNKKVLPVEFYRKRPDMEEDLVA
ncbi:MAG: HAMP domain-containing sensor histidine kinase [Pseudomonadota bacterium]|nr:HAMP domain-containing sensor histidine kinase [Pseudomonadota bacterium]